MNKSKLNLCIDALIFLFIAAQAGLGLVIKYVLIPGREAWTKYGRQIEISWLGLDRPAWIEVQLYLLFLLLGLLALHVIFQWRTILGLLAGLIPQPLSRLGVLSIFLVSAVTPLVLPLLITPEVNEVGIRGDLGLKTPSPGTQELLLGAADPQVQKRDPGIDLAGTATAEVEWTKEDSPVKAAPKKSHFAYWPKSPKYQTIYSANLPGDKSIARSQKRTSTLQARCQPSGRRSPNNKDIGG
jgi:hypothetical protein